MNYVEIQNKVIKQYRITINEHSDCWGRTHAHIKKRMVCKWKQASSIQSTFTLLHEIGHIEANKSWMRRAEQEYYATVWALERCKEYGLDVPAKIISQYQKYIDMEKARGIRRGGTGYDKLSLYDAIGLPEPKTEYKPVPVRIATTKKAEELYKVVLWSHRDHLNIKRVLNIYGFADERRARVEMEVQLNELLKIWGAVGGQVCKMTEQERINYCS